MERVQVLDKALDVTAQSPQHLVIAVPEAVVEEKLAKDLQHCLYRYSCRNRNKEPNGSVSLSEIVLSYVFIAFK